MTDKQTNILKSIAGQNRNANKTKLSSVNKKLVLILILVSLIVYANTFSNGYVYDDFSVISKNAIVTKGISAIPEILSTPYRYGFYKTSNDLYRPLSLVMFAAEYQLFGETPSVGHFINVLLFTGCVVLLFIFLDDLFERKKTVAIFIASLLFALHPVHTEVVANIKSRDELLCFFFSFLSLNVYVRYAYSGKVKLLILASLLFFLSLLSKETSISFLAVIPFIFFFYKNEHKKRSIYITVSSILVAIVFIIIRSSVLRAYHANDTFDIKFIDNFLVGAPSRVSELATAILIMGKYIKLLLIPYPLVCDYSFNNIPYYSFGNFLVISSLLAYTALLVVGIYRLIKFSKDPFAFGIFFFLMTIIMFSNIFFMLGAAMAERFIFFASAGGCLLIALLLEQLMKKMSVNNEAVFLNNKRTLTMIVPISLVLGVMTIVRNNDWASSVILYSADIKHAPDNARLYFFLGNELLISKVAGETDPVAQRELAEEAISALKKSLTIYPDFDEAHRVLGNGYFFMSMLDSAEVHYKRAIALQPGDLEAWNNLDVAYFHAQKFRQSIETCKKIIEIDPQNTEKYNNIGVCYLRLAQYDSAVTILKTGVLHNPGYNPFYENLALAYKLGNNTDSAKRYEAIAQQNNPAFHIY